MRTQAQTRGSKLQETDSGLAALCRVPPGETDRVAPSQLKPHGADSHPIMETLGTDDVSLNRSEAVELLARRPFEEKSRFILR